MEEITDPGRIGYYHDESQEECLAIDIEGLALEKGQILWIWPYKPRPQGSARGYLYPKSVPFDECTPGSSIHVDLAGGLTARRHDKQDSERVWIPIRVPERELSGIRYLVLPTHHLDLPGWGWIRPI